MAPAARKSKMAIFRNIVAAFQGMHVLPAKHSYAWLPKKCAYQTDTKTDRQTPEKVIPMCLYASQATQKGPDHKVIDHGVVWKNFIGKEYMYMPNIKFLSVMVQKEVTLCQSHS